jgi:hypothetical protein
VQARLELSRAGSLYRVGEDLARSAASRTWAMRRCASGPGCPSPVITSAGWMETLPQGRRSAQGEGLVGGLVAGGAVAAAGPRDLGAPRRTALTKSETRAVLEPATAILQEGRRWRPLASALRRQRAQGATSRRPKIPWFSHSPAAVDRARRQRRRCRTSGGLPPRLLPAAVLRPVRPLTRSSPRHRPAISARSRRVPRSRPARAPSRPSSGAISRGRRGP